VTDLVLALHYQNEVVHPQGRIRLGIAEDSPERLAVIAAAERLLNAARARDVPVISVRIAFAPDYANVKTNAEIWRRVVANKVMAEGSWGAEFYEGLAPLPGETVVTHARNDAFYGRA
jgi:nicotinamidase-related amidase